MLMVNGQFLDIWHTTEATETNGFTNTHHKIYQLNESLLSAWNTKCQHLPLTDFYRHCEAIHFIFTLSPAYTSNSRNFQVEEQLIITSKTRAAKARPFNLMHFFPIFWIHKVCTNSEIFSRPRRNEDLLSHFYHSTIENVEHSPCLWGLILKKKLTWPFVYASDHRCMLSVLCCQCST